MAAASPAGPVRPKIMIPRSTLGIAPARLEGPLTRKPPGPCRSTPWSRFNLEAQVPCARLKLGPGRGLNGPGTANVSRPWRPLARFRSDSESILPLEAPLASVEFNRMPVIQTWQVFKAAAVGIRRAHKAKYAPMNEAQGHHRCSQTLKVGGLVRTTATLSASTRRTDE